MKEQELEKMGNAELIGIIKAQRFEIETLNNNINEIEDYIKENSQYYPEFYGTIIRVGLLLDKIKKLKEVDKE